MLPFDAMARAMLADDAITVADVAQKLRVSTSTIYRYASFDPHNSS